MSSITDMVQQHLGDKGLAELSQHLGVDHGTAQTAIAAALPALVGAMAHRNAPSGAAVSPTSTEASAGGFLGGLFGGNHAEVKHEVSKNSGLDAHQAEKALLFLAPIVMAQLTKKRQQDGATPSAEQSHPQSESGSGGLLGMVERVFHKNS